MRPSSRSRACVVALLSLTAASCIPSKNPLSDLERAAPDANLYGTWSRTDKDGAREILVIGRLAEGANRSDLPAGLMRGATLSISKDNRVGRSSSLVFFVSTAGKKTYLNSFGQDVLDRKKWPTFSRAAIDSFLIMKYRLSGDRLEFFPSYSVKALGEAIEKGLVQGIVERGKENKAIIAARLTDTTENLVKFFSRPDSDAVFPDEFKQEYRRLSVPD